MHNTLIAASNVENSAQVLSGQLMFVHGIRAVKNDQKPIL